MAKQCKSRHVSQRPGALDPFAFARRVHRFHRSVRRCTFSQNSGLLPKTRARMSAVGAVTVRRSLQSSLTCLRATPIASASVPWVKPIGSMNSSVRISPTVAGLRVVINMAHLKDSYGRPNTDRFHETNQIGRTELEPADLILRRPRSSRGRLEGWPRARSRLQPSFETPASRAPQDEV